MAVLLSLIAVLLAVAGILRIVQGEILWGVLLLVVAALVGPGGISVFG